MADSNAAAASPPPDPAAILRSRNFVALLVFAAVIGIVVSLVGWGFLELVHAVQVWVFTDCRAGSASTGADVVAAADLHARRAAGGVRDRPAARGAAVTSRPTACRSGSTEPNMVPGVALAALATLGLGLVLGPEAPLIAIGSGVAVFTVRLAKRDAPPQLLLVLGAAGRFAAISVVFGSPIMAAILIIEASGLGGATLPLSSSPA